MRLVSTLTILLALGCDGGSSVPEPDPSESRVWLRGDLHLHSHHSTDALDNRMDAIVARAESVGFDYFVVTDHDNHVDGMLATWDDPAYRSDAMVLLYGVEWTSAVGHANFFGAEPFDHPALYALREGSSGQAIADEAERQGLHFSVNHPLGSDPWELGFEHDIDGIEVWNALFLVPNDNEGALALWDTLLAEGRRITARGGSDNHHQETSEADLFNLGNPTTWVLAEGRTPEAVIAALNGGHATVSYAPSAERIDFTADADGDGVAETVVGDSVPVGELDFRLVITGARAGATYALRVVKNGATFLEREVGADPVTFSDTPTERSSYRVEVRGEVPDAPSAGAILFGDMVALSNPIYVGFDD
ncbi:MAG: PHP domain-containing protein [Deltaproteobacteria bacterium]|nr:PHP domain-containing protein [Deltaproteobacteria bacterium]